MSDLFAPNIGADLGRIHRVISRGLDVAIENTPRLLADPGSPPHEGFLAYLTALATILDGHHEAEDQILFPFFRERIPEAPFDHLSVQHEEMLDNLRELRRALDDLASDRNVLAAARRLLEPLRRLDATWQSHIETEESHLSAERAAEVATPEEHLDLRRRIADFNRQHLVPAALCIPFLLYNLEVEDRAVMASLFPTDVTQELVPGAWRDQWASMRPFLLE